MWKERVWWAHRLNMLSCMGWFKVCVLVRSRDQFFLSNKADKWNGNILLKSFMQMSMVFPSEINEILILASLTWMHLMQRLCLLHVPVERTSATSLGCSIPFLSRDWAMCEGLNSRALLIYFIWKTLKRKKMVLWVTRSSFSPVSSLTISS